MSLRVWLPLTKDLRNQGLDNVTITNNGATYASTGGKLGGCYTFDGNDYIRISMPSSMTTILGCTVAAWVKSTSSTLALGGISQDLSNYTAPCVTLYTSGWQFTSTARSGYGYVSGGTVANTSAWHHVACTVGTDGTIKTYLDGTLVATSTLTTLNVNANTTITSSNFIEIGCDHPGGDEYLTGSVNDFRIYDHCLSQMEVKELAKGLVLHYSFSDKYIESTQNLITTEDCLSSTCYNGAISKYSYGTNTDMYKTVTTYDGRKGTKVYMGTSGNSCFPYVYVNNLYTSNGTNSPEYKTLSFDYYGTVGSYLGPYKLGSGSGTATYTVVCDGNIVSGSYSNSGFFPITLNKWNHIEITFQGTTDADAQWGYIRIGNGSHTSNTSNFWFFANMQLETKDHATGYAGVGGTRTSTITYDCSGFCNNGELYAYDSNGSIIIDNDTPKYNISTFINSADNTTNTASGTRYIYGNCNLTTPQYLTVAFWCKPIAGYGNTTAQGQFSLTNYDIGSSAGSDYLAGPMNHRDGLIDINNYDSSTHKTVNIAFTANEWHHYVIVYDGRYARTYKDGVAGATVDMGSTMTLGSMKGAVIGFSKAGGVWRSNKSYYSDFRIYATALSAEDVLSLYNNSAYIDSSGNIYGAIVREA